MILDEKCEIKKMKGFFAYKHHTFRVLKKHTLPPRDDLPRAKKMIRFLKKRKPISVVYVIIEKKR